MHNRYPTPLFQLARVLYHNARRLSSVLKGLGDIFFISEAADIFRYKYRVGFQRKGKVQNKMAVSKMIQVIDFTLYQK